MCGCLIVGLFVVLLFVLVPLPLWPLLVVSLVVLVALAAALGFLRGLIVRPKRSSSDSRTSGVRPRQHRPWAARRGRASSTLSRAGPTEEAADLVPGRR
jgi:biopolymer transport protein ExbB/TolQ